MKNRMVSMSPIKYSLLLLCLMISCTLSAQTSSGFISGKVYEIYQGKHEPSIGVNVSIETNHIANCTNLDYQIQPKTYPF